MIKIHFLLKENGEGKKKQHTFMLGPQYWYGLLFKNHATRKSYQRYEIGYVPNLSVAINKRRTFPE